MSSQTRNESRYKKTHPNSVPFCTAHNTHAPLKVKLIKFLLVYLPIYLRSILLLMFFHIYNLKKKTFYYRHAATALHNL
jgi:hypothetical protein